ncbi:hypothetical protein PQJ75_16190 [Rhodoplanes sp. TEM]|uniref:Uncharacterized protein n=1 Tax=Rhodoplanes tepidamans TaxID=200616 RepID=A0ABT5JC10_RHOTP|nr:MULTISPECIES: hypothetical protein [Rhodoplanes]MDC7787027.1 hypothetical protein [Rhodoplanes tepidamans]MDC7985275.1 hypothetical protein [Rhodoplanes sp. TEM]MDQ0354248.1 hypothetical protein [Rhodoplanes tepidamans]
MAERAGSRHGAHAAAALTVATSVMIAIPIAVVAAATPAAAQLSEAMKRCIEVQIGNEKSLDCFNLHFKREVDRVNPTLNTPPIGPGSTDLQKGIVNLPAVQQQYGPNFGRSVVPFRPTTTFSTPMR